MRHPYTKDTRRPLLVGHAYWAVPSWIPGAAVRVTIDHIEQDGCFQGVVGTDPRNKPFGHGQTGHNCAVFTEREAAEVWAKKRLEIRAAAYHEHPADEHYFVQLMRAIRKYGVDETPHKLEDWTTWMPPALDL